ncbi:hypothetical protein BB560_001157 [Smittium megazygosporum]|uniref:Uncharacterized protein n=1 Tax=Smittium megazygosporum TaxID=133381 RepID=A0A2T9ZIF2_9FUNG|nr:hypothetical protein BB560_001157 [Smittium megazygosporum]
MKKKNTSFNKNSKKAQTTTRIKKSKNKKAIRNVCSEGTRKLLDSLNNQARTSTDFVAEVRGIKPLNNNTATSQESKKAEIEYSRAIRQKKQVEEYEQHNNNVQITIDQLVDLMSK